MNKNLAQNKLHMYFYTLLFVIKYYNPKERVNRN